MSASSTGKPRPKYLNLMEIRLPLPGFISILHRVSGAGLFIMLPFLLNLFANSLGTPEEFLRFKSTISHPFAKLILLGLLWAYVHHFCAGIRFLALDMHKGIDLPTARKTAGAVLVVSLLLTVVIGVKLW